MAPYWLICGICAGLLAVAAAPAKAQSLDLPRSMPASGLYSTAQLPPPYNGTTYGAANGIVPPYSPVPAGAGTFGTATYPVVAPQPVPIGAPYSAYLPGGTTTLAPGGDCIAPPPEKPGKGLCFVVFGEFLYLKPRGADVPFGVPQNGLAIPGAVPVGRVASASEDFQPGFRAGAGLLLTNGARAEGTYTWFQSRSTSALTAVAPNVINPLVMFPGTFNAGFTAQNAQASYGIDFQLADADYRAEIVYNPRYSYGFLAGARYAHLDQTLTVTYPFAPPDGTTTVASAIRFDGAGPRLGIEGDYFLFPSTGFSVYGRGTASFLVGKFKSSYTQTNQFNGIEVQTGLDVNRIVPILDLELGLAWTSFNEMFRISGGYFVSAWYNTVTTPGWIASVQRLDFLPGKDTLTFDGLTARAEVRF